jgi:hypothetical protein
VATSGHRAGPPAQDRRTSRWCRDASEAR